MIVIVHLGLYYVISAGCLHFTMHSSSSAPKVTSLFRHPIVTRLSIVQMIQAIWKGPLLQQAQVCLSQTVGRLLSGDVSSDCSLFHSKSTRVESPLSGVCPGFQTEGKTTLCPRMHIEVMMGNTLLE